MMSSYDANYEISSFSYFWDITNNCLTSWIFWILLILPFSGPFLYAILCSIGILPLTIYARCFTKYEHYSNYRSTCTVYDGIRKFVATIIYFIGRLWHGYEVVGMEKLFNNGKDGALVVVYHGAIPVDTMYLLCKLFYMNIKNFRIYCAEFMSNFAGWNPGFRIAHMFTGTEQDIIKVLKEGNLVLLQPGGIMEALLGDNKYELHWKNRTGFARVAIEAKVPIIPAFTENIREAFRIIHLPRNWTLKLYKKTKLPCAIFHGILPVKLRTIVGDPIPYDPSLTPEQLAEKVKEELQRLIQKHQRIPGSIPKALLDRAVDKQKLKDI